MSEPGIIECAVCSQPMPKSRLHYGGVSCYSCRAFFRRNAQKEERNDCKEANQCSITYRDRKACTSCRYRKCISAGMIPQLVLTEDAKKQRFKKSIEKKKQNLEQIRDEQEFIEENDELQGRIKEEPDEQIFETEQITTNTGPLSPPPPYSVDTQDRNTSSVMQSSSQPGLPNFSSLNSVTQVLPIIRKISLSHISEFSKSLSESAEEKKEMIGVETEEKYSPNPNWPGRFQHQTMRPSEAPVQHLLGQGNSFRNSDVDRIQMGEPRKRKSVICHTSEVKHFC